MKQQNSINNNIKALHLSGDKSNVDLSALVEVETAPDGSCFYHALSMCMFNHFKASLDLRRLVARYVSRNWEQYKDFTLSSDRIRYCASHGTQGVMATAVQVQAAADVLGVTIVVRVRDENQVYQCFDGEPSQTVYMAFSGDLDRGHFNALVARGQGAKSEQPRVAGRAKPDGPRVGVGARPDAPPAGGGVAPVGGPLPAGGGRPTPGVSQVPAINPTAGQPDGFREEDEDGWRVAHGKTKKGIKPIVSTVAEGPGKQQAAHPVANTPTRAIEPRLDCQTTSEPGQSAIRPGGETSGNGKVKPDPPSAAAAAVIDAGELVKHGKLPQQCSQYCNVLFCSCHYEGEQIVAMQQLEKEKGKIFLSDLNFDFPLKIKLNNRKQVALIDKHSKLSLVSPALCEARDINPLPMPAEVILNETTYVITGVVTMLVTISHNIQVSLPFFVAEMPENASIILGQDFLYVTNGKYADKDDSYLFEMNGHQVSKNRSKTWQEKEWQILNLVELEEIGKLFKIGVAVDSLNLAACIDLGAVRTIINSRWCTNKAELQPAKIKLRVANKTLLPVDGIYCPEITIGSIKVKHPVIVAQIPDEIDILLGNDFTRKYKAIVSWKTETASFEINNHKTTVPILPDQKGQPVNSILQNPSVFACFGDGQHGHGASMPLVAAEEACIPPHSHAMVKVVNSNFLPAIVSPILVNNNPNVGSIECVLVDEPLVPIFNCGDSEVTIQINSVVGYVEKENARIKSSELVETNLAEVDYAIKNNILLLEEIDVPELKCNAVVDSDLPSLPSLDKADLNDEQKLEVQAVLEEFQDVFSYSMKPGATIPGVTAVLQQKEKVMLFKRQWPLSAKQKKIAAMEIDKFEKIGVIEEGHSIVSLPFFVIEKRGSTAECPQGRLLYDSRLLNKSLEKPNYKSYTIQDVLNYCSDKKLLCTMDVVNYFFTIEMSEESKTLLGFNYNNKAYRWARLPQGLSHSPAIAQTAMAAVLRNLNVIYFMDDILTAGKDYNSLLILFIETLKRMRHNNLRLNPSKAVLFRTELPCLGLIIKAGESVRPDPARFRPLISLKSPNTLAQLKSVICYFSYFRRYLKDFAAKTQIYNDMIAEKIPFEWGDKDKQFIEQMYNYLLSEATLALFDEKLETKLFVDASKDNLGSMLTQKRNGKYLPIAYFSMPITEKQAKSWSAYHKEALCLFEAVKYFQAELLMLDSFVVVSDATSLKYLLAMEQPKCPFDRFIAFLSQFNFTFQFIPSAANKVADSLSRIDPPNPDEKDINIPEKLVTKLNNNVVMPVITRSKAKLEQNIETQFPKHPLATNHSTLHAEREVMRPEINTQPVDSLPDPLTADLKSLLRWKWKSQEANSNGARSEPTPDSHSDRQPGDVGPRWSSEAAVTSRGTATTLAGGDSEQKLSAGQTNINPKSNIWKNLLDSKMVIKDFIEKHYFLSNSAPSPVLINGRQYKSVTHALASGKSVSESEHNFVSEAKDPISASSRLSLQPESKKVNVKLLKQCLENKFNSKSIMAKLLLETLPNILIFTNSECDNELGCCICNKCNSTDPKNLLGILLMTVRQNLLDSYDEKLELAQKIPSLAKFIENQRKDPQLLKIISTFDSEGNPTDNTDSIKGIPKYCLRKGLLVTNTKQPRTIVPKQLIPALIEFFHDLSLHSGRNIMLLLLRRHYYFKNMEDLVSEYVKTCEICGKHKTSLRTFGKLQPKVSIDVFDNINADFTHIYSAHPHYTNCLVISDSFSNLVLLRPCKAPTSEALTDGLIQWFSRYGLCRNLHIDAGPQSTCKAFKDFLDRLGINLIVSPSNAHFSSGRVESMVKRTITTLRYLIDNKKSRLMQWHKLLPLIEFKLNKTPGLATKLSAHEICFGRILNEPATLKSVVPSGKTLKERINTLEFIRKQAQIAQNFERNTYMRKYNKNKHEIVFTKGQPVFVEIEKKATKLNPEKFQPKYKIGTIKKKISKVVYIIRFREPGGRIWTRRTHIIHLKQKFPRPKYLQNKGTELFFVKIDDEKIPLFPLSDCPNKQSKQTSGNLPVLLCKPQHPSSDSRLCLECYHKERWTNLN